jgi:ribonuclease HII
MNKYYKKDIIEVGIDEVARGCLFGRVYSACVIWPQDDDNVEEDEYQDINEYLIKDSKKLTKKKREELYDYIINRALDYRITYGEHDLIDDINIRNAVYNIMHSNLDNMLIDPDLILVDGDYFPKYKNIKHKCIVGGDNKYISIAAASILAKVEHDRYIEDICEQYPYLHEQYDLLNNMGYGTKKHMEGIKKYGISDFHRRSFGICKKY